MTEKGDKVTRRILKKAHDAIYSDMVHAPEARRPGAFPYAKKFKAAFAAAALILLLALGVLGYRENLGERLKGWFYGADARKEVNISIEKHKAPAY